jgi:uncharacterized protein (TIGR04255 family)
MRVYGSRKVPLALAVQNMPNPLPEFERPPLEEMVVGVQFEPLLNLRAAHLGMYWSPIRAEYPFTEDQAPVSHVVEALELKATADTLAAIQLKIPPLPRCWFLTEDKTQLLQVQRDRFLRNWRRVVGDERYPRFGHLTDAFKRAWVGFLTFAEAEQLGPVKVNQCELTYINNIERGAGWTELGELDRVLRFQRPREPGGFLPPPELVTWQVRYKFPDGRGRLHVEMNPIFRGRDMSLALALNLTARGAPTGGSLDEIFAWFDLAHEWIARAFAELTAPESHELWGRMS